MIKQLLATALLSGSVGTNIQPYYTNNNNNTFSVGTNLTHTATQVLTDEQGIDESDQNVGYIDPNETYKTIAEVQKGRNIDNNNPLHFDIAVRKNYEVYLGNVSTTNVAITTIKANNPNYQEGEYIPTNTNMLMVLGYWEDQHQNQNIALSTLSYQLKSYAMQIVDNTIQSIDNITSMKLNIEYMFIDNEEVGFYGYNGYDEICNRRIVDNLKREYPNSQRQTYEIEVNKQTIIQNSNTKTIYQYEELRNVNLPMINITDPYIVIFVQPSVYITTQQPCAYIVNNNMDDADTNYVYPMVFDTTNNATYYTINGYFYGTSTNEIIDIPSVMWTVLTMPFTWFSIAFNVTLFPNTPYAVNIGNLLLCIIAVFIFIFIIKLLIKLMSGN